MDMIRLSFDSIQALASAATTTYRMANRPTRQRSWYPMTQTMARYSQRRSGVRQSRPPFGSQRHARNKFEQDTRDTEELFVLVERSARKVGHVLFNQCEAAVR